MKYTMGNDKNVTVHDDAYPPISPYDYVFSLSTKKIDSLSVESKILSKVYHSSTFQIDNYIQDYNYR